MNTNRMVIFPASRMAIGVWNFGICAPNNNQDTTNGKQETINTNHETIFFNHPPIPELDLICAAKLLAAGANL